MRRANLAALLFAIPIYCLADAPAQAYDPLDPALLTWTGTLGTVRVSAEFSVSDQAGFGSIALSRLSKDDTLCDRRDPLFSATLSPDKKQNLRILSKKGDKPHDGYLMATNVTLEGIPYLRLTGKVISDGVNLPLVLRAVVEGKFKDSFGKRERCDVRIPSIDLLPTKLRALFKPSLRSGFERYAKDNGFQLSAGQTDTATGKTDRIENSIDITGIPAGNERAVATALLKQPFILDVAGIPRPTNPSIERKDDLWTGRLGNDVVGFDGLALNDTQCARREMRLYLEDMRTYFVVIEQKSGQFTELRARRQFTVERDIPLEKIETPEFELDGTRVTLQLRRPLGDLGLAINRCVETDNDSPTVKVIVYPAFEQAARDYFIGHKFEWHDFNDRNAGATNEFVVDLPSDGSGVDELIALRKQGWVLDAWYLPAELGDLPMPITFPGHSLYRTVADDQERLRARLQDTLQEIFPKFPLGKQGVSIDGQGLSYSFNVEAPVDALGNEKFKGYWIKANSHFSFNRMLIGFDETTVADTMSFVVTDAWLARWPSPTTPPPEGHYDHLSPTAADKFKNFESLKWLQQTIVDQLRIKWSGVR